MSAKSEAAETVAVADERCASCGVKGGGDDNITLKNCNGCFLVKYCGVECQRNHRDQHERDCKRRAAELKDEILFKQPESTHLGDCPLCQLPIPIPKLSDRITEYVIHCCCSKIVCNGCERANMLREQESRLTHKCPFCRHPLPKTEAELDQLAMKRVEANDPEALYNLGTNHFKAGNYSTAIEVWEKASGLGHADADCKLSVAYHDGQGVEQDTDKFIFHAEQAAISGHVFARCNLGAWEFEKYNYDRAAKHLINYDRAVKHFMIAAHLGHDPAIKALKKFYAAELVSKEDYGAALLAYQAAVGASKSPQRDAAKDFLNILY